MADKNRILTFLIHLIGWGLVFGFPLFFTWKEGNPMTWVKFGGYVSVPVAFMIVFYANYFIFIDRMLFRKQLLLFVVTNLLLFIVLSFCLHWWQEFYIHCVDDTPKEPRRFPPRSVFIIRDGCMMALMAALSLAIRMTENWYIIEREKKELENARSEAELQNLKNQLNPHFLFNTLNNIYSLIAIDPDRAQFAVHDLSRLLRHVLYEDNQRFVSLDQELNFMKSYIELMSLRLSERVDLKVRLLEDGKGLLVAPLLFITLIENAFKHGVAPIAPSFIHISLEWLEPAGIRCYIENSYFPKKESDRSGSGIGLENLRKRLELLYPGKYFLRTEREGDKFVAELVIQI